MDRLLKEPEPHIRQTGESWFVYDGQHLFNPQLDSPLLNRSLYVGDQEEDLRSHLMGKKYGEPFPERLLPKLLMTRPMPTLEEMRAHVIEFGGLHYILESVSPAHEFLFRKVGARNWSGWGEEHLIVFKKEGGWAAEHQSVETRTTPIENVGDGTENAHFQFRVLPRIFLYWGGNNIVVPVQTTDPQSKELPSVVETVKALQTMPPLLLGGLQAIQLIDEKHKNNYYGQMDSAGILRLYRGSRDKHLHATLFHELAHWFAMRFLGSVFLAGQAGWIRAMMQDAHNASHYAPTNIGEDFAETVALYFLTGGGRCGKEMIHFKNRFKLLDELFYSCFTQTYHAQYSASTAAHSHVST